MSKFHLLFHDKSVKITNSISRKIVIINSSKLPLQIHGKKSENPQLHLQFHVKMSGKSVKITTSISRNIVGKIPSKLCTTLISRKMFKKIIKIRKKYRNLAVKKNGQK